MSEEKSMIEPTDLSKTQIESLALSVRNKLNYNPEIISIYDFVTNVMKGKIEYKDDEIEAIGGSIDVRSSADFTLTLPSFTPDLRDVFTIAHELGHFFLHSLCGTKPIKAYNDNSDTRAENEANIFAFEFLMPREQIAKDKENGLTKLQMCSKYKVSLTILNKRLSQLEETA